MSQKGNIYEVDGRFIVRFGRDVTKNCGTREEAEVALTGMRHETNEGRFDKRDYKKGAPNSFETLSNKWLKKKKRRLCPKWYKTVENYFLAAQKEWAGLSLKSIGSIEIEDYLEDLADHYALKTLNDIKKELKEFWEWAVARNPKSFVMPIFPTISFESELRTITNKKSQEKVLEEIRRTTGYNAKIWWGIRFLTRYVKIRPGELIRIKESQINLDLEYIIFKKTKEKKIKYVFLLDDDLEFLKSLPPVMDKDLYFFRHDASRKQFSGKPFGNDYLAGKWKASAARLGIKDVPLYPGTKHTSVTALGEHLSPETIRKSGTQHAAGSCFDRYFLPERKQELTISSIAAGRIPEQHLNNRKSAHK